MRATIAVHVRFHPDIGLSFAFFAFLELQAA